MKSKNISGDRNAPTDLTRRQLLNTGALALAGSTLATAASAEPAARPKKWDHEFDVVVIGCGISGGAAAYEAARAGAKVAILDRGSAAANESHGSVIYMGGGTPLQKSLNVQDSPEQMEKYLLAANGPEPDAKRIRLYVERSLEHFLWLAELGMPFREFLNPVADVPHEGGLYFSGVEQAFPFREIAVPAQRGHVPSTPGGRWIQKTMLEKTAAMGVAQLLSADAQGLIQGPDRTIEGVATTVDGAVQSFRARHGVILATGGFANNPDMTAQYAPRYLGITPLDVGLNDGWGIRAGLQVGAAIQRMDAMAPYWALYPPVSRKAGILVNEQGQRFVAEDSYYGIIGDLLVREQNGVANLLVDAESIGERPPNMLALYKDEIMAQAGTIAELEHMLGIAEPALQRTVEIYNRYAAKAQDPFFRKGEHYLRPLAKPPFSAIKASVGKTTVSFFTLGGLRTSIDAEVLDDSGKPIPGFYAVGRVVSGIPASNYYTSGLSLGEGTLFGRIAGINAAGRRT